MRVRSTRLLSASPTSTTYSVIIVSVSAQRAAKCFFAVVETVSDVGQKFASVCALCMLDKHTVARFSCGQLKCVNS